MYYICDAIMGSGKTSGCVTYINRNSDKRFLYLTQYLPEVQRMLQSTGIQFYEPRNDLWKYHNRKIEHCHALLKDGVNIASTHQLFKRYTPDIIDTIKKMHYTLIIDESPDIFADANLRKSDFEFLMKGGYIKELDGQYAIVNDVQGQHRYKDIFYASQNNQLVSIPSKSGRCHLFEWLFTTELLDAFDDVIVLTYMFEAQDLAYLLKINGVDYQYIGVSKSVDGVYDLTDQPTHQPAYVSTLKDKIHIFDNDKMNHLDRKHPTMFSSNWYANKPEEVKIAKNALYNYFRYYCEDIPYEKKMWGTFDKAEYLLRGKGFSNGFVIFNKKSSNDFRDRDHLAYLSNIYMNPYKVRWLQERGCDVLEDKWALSIMIQWIWRSAIRDGKEIWIYIPSTRMRHLLENWIEETRVA